MHGFTLYIFFKLYAIVKGGQGLKDGDISAICLFPGYFFKFLQFQAPEAQ